MEADDAVELFAEIPVHTCEDCGSEFIDSVGEDLRHAAVCEHLDLLAPVQVLGIRKQYAFTRVRFSEITGLGMASLARWETGQLMQGKANDCYLYLLSFRENIDRLIAKTSRSILPGAADLKTDPQSAAAVFPNLPPEQLPSAFAQQAEFRLVA